MCDEALDDFLPTLKFAPDWFVTSKIIKKLFTDLHADEIVLYFDADFGNVVLTLMKMILVLSLLSEFWIGIVNLKNVKHLKRVK